MTRYIMLGKREGRRGNKFWGFMDIYMHTNVSITARGNATPNAIGPKEGWH